MNCVSLKKIPNKSLDKIRVENELVKQTRDKKWKIENQKEGNATKVNNKNVNR